MLKRFQEMQCRYTAGKVNEHTLITALYTVSLDIRQMTRSQRVPESIHIVWGEGGVASCCQFVTGLHTETKNLLHLESHLLLNYYILHVCTVAVI